MVEAHMFQLRKADVEALLCSGLNGHRNITECKTFLSQMLTMANWQVTREATMVRVMSFVSLVFCGK